ncbi:TBC1 domain family member 8B-like [Rhipicephalus sanguineus]|uniref:TBC1 domain family member 8B-like n=1 Tax=Rhipicephalus sanguineus TaxID=34632 RepID=UPI0020C3B327|nr:TBC1 domain family member 8B-like [Rhipicephalus sanguineus]
MTLPDMNQEQFVQMWQTVYNLFVGHPDEQDFYHALACTGTELLQMGEMNHEAKTKPDNSAGGENSRGDGTTDREAPRDCGATAATVSSDMWDRHWHISFQQFRACLHKDEHLASFFDTKTPVSSALEGLRSSRIQQRASSTPPLTGAIKV